MCFSSFMEKEGREPEEQENLENSLENIRRLISTSVNEKNIEILSLVADFVREMNGLRCTSCKSAKDRTSMAVSWEQGRWLKRMYVDIVDTQYLKG